MKELKTPCARVDTEGVRAATQFGRTRVSDSGTMHRFVIRLAIIVVVLSAASASRAGAQISVVGSTVARHDARPGQSYAGSFTVRNDSDAAQEARLYLTDYAATADGVYRYEPAGSTARSNATWITLERPRITVPPHRTVTVPFTVTVPAGSVLAGTHWSMIMVEGLASGAGATAESPRDVQVGLVTKVRYAVQVATNVAGEAKRSVQFARPDLSSNPDGGRVLAFDIINDGGIAFTPAISVELYSDAGEAMGTFESSRELTYPGNSLRATFDLGAVPAGSYQALVLVNAGADEVFGAQFALRF